METVALLESLGMTKASQNVKVKLERQRKMMTAYQNYAFVSGEAVESFNKKLKEKTLCVYDKETNKRIEKVDPKRYNKLVYDKLTFTKLAEYGEVPPADVLSDLSVAVERNCFDSFEVAKVESVVEVIDPIIFGKIDGCGDLFMIAQWDEDVKFEDLQKEMPNGI